MKMNSKTAGIFFLFICLLIVLFIGQWSNSRGGSNDAYLGQMESFTEGKADKTTKKPMFVGAPNLGQTTRKSMGTTKKPMFVGAPNLGQTTRKSMESFKEGIATKGGSARRIGR